MYATLSVSLFAAILHLGNQAVMKGRERKEDRKKDGRQIINKEQTNVQTEDTQSTTDTHRNTH